MPRPKKDNPLKRVTVSVDPADYTQMEELAKQSGCSTAGLIRRSMKDFLKKHRHSSTHPSKAKQYG